MRKLYLAIAAAAAVSGLTALPLAQGSSANVTFTIDVAAGHRVISPLIYGLSDDATNYGQGFTPDVRSVHPTVIRLGGDRFTALNWTNSYSNAGADYYYENDDYMDPSSSAPGGAYAATIEHDEKARIPTIVTIPIQGYVSADDNNNPPDVRDSGPDYLSTRFDREEPIGPKQATPSAGRIVYENQFVYWLAKHFPHAKLIFSLDNEPDYWYGSHPEVHPDPASYVELTADDLAYARAIKSVMPKAQITGPVLGGWDGEINLDQPYPSVDYAKYGNFTDYWLKHVAAAGKSAHRRLITDYDVHWYPQIANVDSDDTSAAAISAREHAPLSLWDPSFVEDSYITMDEGYGALELIPRLEHEIAANNPGTNLDFSEWDYGAGTAISGGIAVADVLGIFGRYGVHLATYWPQDSVPGSYTAAAFRIFRDYNGHGATFGNTELKAITSNVDETSVYASIFNRSTHKLVIVAINKNTVPEVATVRLTHSPCYGTAHVYTLSSSGGPYIRSAGSITPSRADVYHVVMPAQSVSVLVLIVK